MNRVDASVYQTTTLRNGRRVEYLVEGDTDGFPLVLHHGTPGAAATYPRLSAAAAERGLALVLTSRPGYGESTPRPGRAVADVVPDVVAVLDDIGRDEFITLGWSGGGPHALACAGMLPQRCLATATGAAVAPFGAGGLDFFAGMGTASVLEFYAAQRGRSVLEPFLEQEAAGYGAVSVENIASALDGLLSPADEVFASGEFAFRLLTTFKRAIAQGVEGWVEDDLAFTRPWGFHLEDITVPVSVWQGGEDRMIPSAHGKWLAAQLPGASLHLYDDEGHLSLWNKVDAILDDLITQAGL